MCSLLLSTNLSIVSIQTMSETLSPEDFRKSADVIACGLIRAAVMGLDKGMNSLGMY